MSSVEAKYSIADIPDEEGYFSRRTTDDQIKALLFKELGEHLIGAVNRMSANEFWEGVVHVGRIDRMPKGSRAQERYLAWLNGLPK